MQSKFSVQDVRAAAEAAITTRTAADAAKKASDAAPDDANLKSAYETAETAATAAKTKVDGLSQDDSKGAPEWVAKHKRKIAIMKSELKNAGALDDDEEDDDIDMGEIDPDKPLTLRDLEKMEAKKASQSAMQMANTIADPLARDAVKAALARVVPSGDSQKDFTDAVAIANREKNSKILEEIGRKGITPQHRSGAGSPPAAEEGAFEATAEEAKFMKPPFSLSKEAVLAARKAGQK